MLGGHPGASTLDDLLTLGQPSCIGTTFLDLDDTMDELEIVQFWFTISSPFCPRVVMDTVVELFAFDTCQYFNGQLICHVSSLLWLDFSFQITLCVTNLLIDFSLQFIFQGICHMSTSGWSTSLH